MKANSVKTSLSAFLMISAATFVVCLLSGCAFTKDYVALSYVPQSNVAKIQGAEAVTINIEVTDVRSVKDRVSVKKNGYGMEMASIMATNDVATLLKTAVQSELSNRGFNCRAGNSVAVLVNLNKFYSDFKMGLFSGSAAAEVTMNIQVKSSDGTIAFSSVIAGEGTNPSLQIMSGANAKIALEAALKDAVGKLMADKIFIESLMNTGNKDRADANRSR